MTTPTIIACVIIILLALLCIPFFKSYKVRKKQRDEEERITDLKYQTEKEKIKAYGESINDETRNKNK
jgi:Tfp pilus assembly major pilin PilA